MCYYNRHLEERLLLLEQHHSNTNDDTTLQERCLALQQQVEEMEVSNIHISYCSNTRSLLVGVFG